MSKRPKKCKNLYDGSAYVKQNPSPKKSYKGATQPESSDAGITAKLRKVFGQTMSKRP